MLTYFSTKPGISKFITILLGVILSILSALGHYDSVIRKEEKNGIDFDFWKSGMELMLIVSAVIFLILSFISFTLFILLLAEEHILKTINKIIDAVYHIIAGLILVTGGILMIISTAVVKSNQDEIKTPNNSPMVLQDFGLKMCAGTFGILNGGIYLITSGLIFTTHELESVFSGSNQSRNNLFESNA